MLAAAARDTARSFQNFAPDRTMVGISTGNVPTKLANVPKVPFTTQPCSDCSAEGVTPLPATHPARRCRSLWHSLPPAGNPSTAGVECLASRLERPETASTIMATGVAPGGLAKSYTNPAMILCPWLTKQASAVKPESDSSSLTSTTPALVTGPPSSCLWLRLHDGIWGQPLVLPWTAWQHPASPARSACRLTRRRVSGGCPLPRLNSHAVSSRQ